MDIKAYRKKMAAKGKGKRLTPGRRMPRIVLGRRRRRR